MTTESREQPEELGQFPAAFGTISESVKEPRKTSFKLFDFFANCEYFENDFIAASVEAGQWEGVIDCVSLNQFAA